VHLEASKSESASFCGQLHDAQNAHNSLSLEFTSTKKALELKLASEAKRVSETRKALSDNIQSSEHKNLGLLKQINEKSEEYKVTLDSSRENLKLAHE
jgi:hypothetical protein